MLRLVTGFPIKYIADDESDNAGRQRDFREA